MTLPELSPGQWLARLTPAWRQSLAWLTAALLVLLALFASDWSAMANQWWNTSTYNHVLLIPVIFAWLVWQRLPQLARIAPHAWSPGLLLCAGAALVWVLGAFSGLSVARQAGAIGMALGASLTLLGPKAAWGMAFPLCYLAFLLPLGDELVPALQMITAFLTVTLVKWSSIRATIDGVFINTPAGIFEVAEACSGVKFLIAMIAFGVLLAHVGFKSWYRRIAVVLLSIAVPVLANSVRAWGTIYVAQYKGAAYAGGFDHIVYGWLFFALVIALVIALAWHFFDRPASEALIDAEAINTATWLERLSRWQLRPPVAIAAIVGMVLAAMAWVSAANALNAALPHQIFLPVVKGWHRVDYKPQEWWQPHAQGANHHLMGRYQDAKGRTVDVFFALYAGQDEGREAGGFGQGALPDDGTWSWQSPGPPVPDARTDRLMGARKTERVAATWYRTGSVLTGSNARLKLANTLDRLLLRERPTMTLILSAEVHPGHSASDALDAFRLSTGPVAPWMDRMAAGR